MYPPWLAFQSTVVATLQDTIGAAIGDVIITFTAVTIAAAEYGNTWADVAQHAEKGRAMVVPIGVEIDPDRHYATQAYCTFRFGVRLELPSRGAKAVNFAAILSEFRAKFNPNATTLQDAVAALSASTQPATVTVIANIQDPGLARGDLVNNPDFVGFDVTITAECFATL